MTIDEYLICEREMGALAKAARDARMDLDAPWKNWEFGGQEAAAKGIDDPRIASIVATARTLWESYPDTDRQSCYDGIVKLVILAIEGHFYDEWASDAIQEQLNIADAQGFETTNAGKELGLDIDKLRQTYGESPINAFLARKAAEVLQVADEGMDCTGGSFHDAVPG